MAIQTLRLLTIVTVVMLLALLLYVGDVSDSGSWFPAILFALWAIGPTITAYACAMLHNHRRWFVHVMIVFIAISSTVSGIAYYQSFFASTSSTSGLIMVFMPLAQWVGLACVGIASALFVGWQNRARPQQEQKNMG